MFRIYQKLKTVGIPYSIEPSPCVSVGAPTAIWLVSLLLYSSSQDVVRADIRVGFPSSHSTANASMNPGTPANDSDDDEEFDSSIDDPMANSEALAEVGILTSTGARAFASHNLFSLRSSAQYASPGGFLGSGSADSSVDAEFEAFNGNFLIPTLLNANFFLPPSVLEITQNAEAATEFQTSIARLDATLVYIDLGQTLFSFQAELALEYVQLPTGGLGFEYEFTTLSASTLDNQADVTPLLNPLITEVSDGFTTTVTAEFPAFHSSVDLGLVGPRTFASVSYRFDAGVTGGGFDGSSASAAINDPLTFSGDVLTFTNVDVPEPTGLIVMATFAVTVLGRRRCLG